MRRSSSTSRLGSSSGMPRHLHAAAAQPVDERGKRTAHNEAPLSDGALGLLKRAHLRWLPAQQRLRRRDDEAEAAEASATPAEADATPAEADTTPAEARPDLVADPSKVRGGGDSDARPVGISGLAGSIDPSMLTEEALARNPLSIGVEKRAPFVLAEGADPLDPASYDWDKDKDGHWIISFSDLSLTDVDKETLLDALVYPSEYEDEDPKSIQFPDRIRALDDCSSS